MEQGQVPVWNWIRGVQFHGRGNGRWEGEVGRGAEGTAKVADVAAREDGGCAGCAGEGGYVAQGVLENGRLVGLFGRVARGVSWWRVLEDFGATYPGYVEEVEAPVSQEVVGSVLPDLELAVEGDLTNVSPSGMPMSDAARLDDIMLCGKTEHT